MTDFDHLRQENSYIWPLKLVNFVPKIQIDNSWSFSAIWIFGQKVGFRSSVLHSSHSNGIQNMEICRGAVALLFSPPVKLVIADGSLAQKRGKKCNNPIVCKSVEKFSDQVWEEMMHSIISSPRTLKNCENFWWPSNQSYENLIDSVLEKDVKNAHYYKKYKFSNKFSATEFLKKKIFFFKSKLMQKRTFITGKS